MTGIKTTPFIFFDSEVSRKEEKQKICKHLIVTPIELMFFIVGLIIVWTRFSSNSIGVDFPFYLLPVNIVQQERDNYKYYKCQGMSLNTSQYSRYQTIQTSQTTTIVKLSLSNCHFQAVIVKLSLSSCYCQAVILKLSFLSCDCQAVIVKRSLSSCHCQTVIVKLSLSRCPCQAVLSSCHCQAVNIKLSLSSC